MDIKLDTECGKFKFRVCGILKHKDKYLTVKINNNSFYCLPGGHVELGEDTNEAVLREMQEELGYEIKIKKLIAVNQNFFKTNDNKPFHEIGFYYIVEALHSKNVNENDYFRDELDKGKIQHLDFKWFSLDELKEIDFRPGFIIDHLKNKQPKVVITKEY